MFFYFNHIFLGNIYLLISFFMFLIAGFSILIVRFELFYPGINIILPDFFYSLISIHGIIMIFGAIMPSLIGLSYWLVPFFFNCRNINFYYLSLISLLLILLSLLILISSLFLPDGFITTGWTLYTPLSIQAGVNIDYVIFSIILISLSTIINSINISITILRNFKDNLSIFLWTLLISCYLIIISTPVLIGVMFMLLLDRYFKTSFFNPVLKGNVIFYQHIFWFFGHPEVYIIILPFLGIISNIISVFSKKLIFGYRNMIYAIISISFMSLLVWGHHMYVTGISYIGQLFFMYCTMLISIPTGVKVFNWLCTIWNGHIIFNVPLLFSLGFIIFFIVGGFSGFILSISPINIYFHGTYFVVAHFHYILVSCSLFSFFSYWYYWSPIIFKIKYNEFNAKIHFWISFFYINFSFFLMHFLGFKGMPRRYIDYSFKYCFYHRLITYSSVFLFLSQIFFIYYIFFPLILNF